jgi:hypothetical protein
MKKKGRPKKAPAERLSALVTFAVTERESEAIYTSARKARLGVSAYIRLRLKELEFFSK